MKILVKQAGKQVQRMRNIVVILAMFVCTSICLGWQQEITISGDIVDHDKVRELERQEEQLKQRKLEQPQLWRELESKLEQLESRLPQLEEITLPPKLEELKQLASVQQRLTRIQKLQEKLENMPNHKWQQLSPQEQDQKLTLVVELPELEQQLEELLEQQKQQKLPQLWTQQELEEQQQQLLQLGSVREYSDIAGNGNPNKYPDEYKYGKVLTDGDGNAIWNNPNNNHLIINPGAKVGKAFGAKMNKASIVKNKNNKDFLSMTNNEVIVSGGKFGCVDTSWGLIAGAFADDIDVDMNISSNTVIITGGTDIRDVYGGCTKYGTVSSNTVTISSSVTIKENVFGAWIGDGLASSNTVTITGGRVGGDVLGGYIVKNGTATLNKVNLTSVTVSSDVYGAMIGKDEDEDEAKKVGEYGLASSNTVTITSGKVGWNVYGGYIVNNGTATGNKVNLSDVDVTRDVYGARIGRGVASSNEVTITGGKVREDVYGGYVYTDGTATGNKVNLSDVDVTRDVYGAMVGTDKKAEFERAMEEATEAYERVLDRATKFAEADITELTIVARAMIAEAEIAITATKALKAFNSLAAAAAEAERAEFERDRKAITDAFEKVVVVIGGAEFEARLAENKVQVTRAERAKYEEKTKEEINKFKAEIVKYKRYVIAGIARAEATYVLASSNTVTITSGKVGQNVYGGYIVNNGTATGNTVTISGGKIKGNVFGGYVGGNGEATYNTINITASTEFSPESILCGGICADADKNDAITGNTLNIETKGIEVKGISNFEKYKFNLKDIKPGETVLTATGGGCSWNTREDNYTSDCAVDLSKSSISSFRTQGVLNKKDRFTLIKSPHGFEGKVETKQCEFENEGLLIKYYWDIKIADNKEDLEAVLADKKIRDEGFARSLSEGYGAGVVCVNNGMDCIFSKMEETEEQSSKSLLGLQRKGEIGAFGGLTASKSKYDIDKGSHIDMIGMSMMGGVGVRVEVGRKELSSELSSKEQNSSEQSSEQSSPELSSKKPSSKELGSELTVGVFAEHGTGNSDIQKLSFSGLSPCENKNEGKSSYTGGGLLGRYNIYEDEFSGTKELSSKIYVEAILRAGQVENKFESKKMKDSKGKEYKYKYADAMYGGCAVGGGYKHKVSEKIDLDWSLRYMFGRQWEKDVKREDTDGNRMKFKNVTSNRIRIGVRGKYVELEKVKPYAGIGCEYELDGKVKGAIENGVDMIDMPVSDFGGVTGIGELGVSGKVWKFGVDISGQGYLGVRKGFGGMLKVKYAFGKRQVKRNN